MSIKEQLIKIKSSHRQLLSDLGLVLIVVFVGLASFGLGRLSVTQIDQPITLVLPAEQGQTMLGSALDTESVVEDQSHGQVVASKNGSKYHFPWCSGATRMKEENKVWFNSITEAKAAGYEPAANCKGLK